MKKLGISMGALGIGATALGMVIAGGCGAGSSELTGSGGSGTGKGTGAGSEGGSNFGGGFGVGGGSGAMGPTCKVPPDSDDAVVGTCDDIAPANSFEPALQWEWTAPPPSDSTSFITGSYVTPLVGNFTDDNDDGDIDLCDTPDVLVSVIDSFQFDGLGLTSQNKLYMLDGATGTEIMTFPGLVDGFVYPAFGDIDNDGLPEVVTANQSGQIVAFEHDGSPKWTGPVGGYRTTFASAQCTATAIYDIDADGTPEIILGYEVFDAQGNRLWGIPGNAAAYDGQYWCVTPTAADLDDDGKLEVLFGHETYDDDGTLMWSLPSGQPPGHPHVANLDSDPEPEVFITNANGIWVLEHDGTVKFGPLRPTDPNPAPNCWGKPGVIHDFDGDGDADIAASTCTDYTVYDVAPSTVSIRWSSPVSDLSGLATATAFDFLGDAVAEAIYADENQIYIYDGVTGAVNLTQPRSSGTLIEYPVVADIDNDGSAEIVYVSNYTNPSTGPTVSVTRDAMDRWIPARRIWNQYSYHVTNVREDGTIPATMKKSWQNLNTFRVNSQIGEAGDCIPEPPK
ncbi:MAG: VCBS repeat-containing protein [Myxococcales bacterium]|nr:VCBS repeat-containing protein [Myxococcales bacterium]